MAKHDSLKKGQTAARKLGIDRLDRHILLCCDVDAAHCASRKRMKQSAKHLKKRAKQLRLGKQCRVMVTRSECFGVCRDGPVAVVYPDGVWYGRCDPPVLDRIIDEHLLGGKTVDEYVLARMKGEGSRMKGEG